jgi:hypothetical protein
MNLVEEIGGVTDWASIGWPWRCTPNASLLFLPLSARYGKSNAGPWNLSPETRNHFHFFGTHIDSVFHSNAEKNVDAQKCARGKYAWERISPRERGCNDSRPMPGYRNIYIDRWFVAWIRTVRECTRIAPVKLHARHFRYWFLIGRTSLGQQRSEWPLAHDAPLLAGQLHPTC